MTPVFVVMVVGTIALLFVFLVLYTRRRERDRTEALRQVAETAGLAFQPKAEVEAVRSLGDVRLFTLGHSRRVSNLMTGRRGDDQVAVFDYRYTTGGGKHQHTSHQTVVMLPGAKRRLPDLHMSPENALHKIAEMFGHHDIDIDSNPEFSRLYAVRGADEEGIRAVLYRGAASYFAGHEGWTVEVLSGTVAIYHAGRRQKPEEFAAFIESACAAARSL